MASEHHQQGQVRSTHKQATEAQLGVAARALRALNKVGWGRFTRFFITAAPTANAIALILQEALTQAPLNQMPGWVYAAINVAVILSAVAAKICAQLLVNRDFARWYSDDRTG